MPSYKRPTIKKRSTSQFLLFVLVLVTTHMPVASELKLQFMEIAPGIYLHLGPHAQMSIENAGNIANIGYIVGAKSVAVIDPGGSPEVGALMREAIQATTDLPISHVILTHIHPDHIFGGNAFSDVVNVVAHSNFPRAMLQRGEFYRSALSDLFDSVYPTPPLTATMTVNDSLRIDLGNRWLLLQAHQTAHTDNDLSVFDESTETLWASDLIFAQRIPSLDGSLIGWLEVMQDLKNLQAELIVPGHGLPGSWEALVAPQRRYLQTLLIQTREYVNQNRRLSEAVKFIATEEEPYWAMFEQQHPGNVTKAYTELEWE